jgi:predicted Fe-Mo cluster-binding NifX family protein
MKIAILTNDLINIANDILKSDRIKIFQIDKKCILNEEFIVLNFKNDLRETVSFLVEKSVATIIVNNINNELELEFNKNKISVICSQESIITNAITSFLKDSNLKESNYCCCP